MDYKLAKQLKDAGFPQASISGGAMQGQWVKGTGLEEVYIPTLSELIEACGDGFNGLVKIVDGWSAVGLNHHLNDGIRVIRSTPEEAVANLWLSLNKRAKCTKCGYPPFIPLNSQAPICPACYAEAKYGTS